jgi:hypothetical protein
LIILTFLIASCSSINNSSLRAPANYNSKTDTSSCIDSLNQIAKSIYAIKLSKKLKVELPIFKSELNKSLGNINDYGVMRFRGKESSSIFHKISGKVFRKISDGMGARFIIKDTSSQSMDSIFNLLLSAVSSGELRVKEIRNYQLESGYAYFSDEQVFKLRDAVASRGGKVKVLTGKQAVRKKGYTSFHMKILTKDNTKAEFQLRGHLLQEVNELDHLFYDGHMGKGLSSKFIDSVELTNVYKQFMSMELRDREIYFEYLETVMKYTRQLETGEQVGGELPEFPRNLFEYQELEYNRVLSYMKPYF